MKKNTNRKFWVTSIVVGIIAFTAFSFRPPSNSSGERFNNLKVLPKDISNKELKNVMREFSNSLGMMCSDCHVKAADNPEELDFASDALPNKRTALDMMKMVKRINKKEFKIKGKFADNFMNNTYKITCNTCHNGNAQPALNTKLGVPKDKK